MATPTAPRRHLLGHLPELVTTALAAPVAAKVLAIPPGLQTAGRWVRSVSPIVAALALIAMTAVREGAAKAGEAGGGARRMPLVALDTMTQNGQKYVAALEGGGMAELTLRPELQDAAMEVFQSFHLPFAAAAVVSVRDGRVLALAGHSERDPSLGPAELALRPWAPAASVFKIVAASALVAEAGLGGNTRVCYHGGVSAVLPDNLVDIPKIDTRCDTLAWGLGKSQNAIIAKLADRHLTPERLGRVAAAFGFDEALPFEAPFEPSTVDIPSDKLEFARASAGFYHSSLSVLHGALIAATIANGGLMPSPRIVASGLDFDGRPLVLPASPSRRVLPVEAAREVGRMMEVTTRTGTAKGTFRDKKGRPLLPVEVAGKTGTLSFRHDPSDPQPPAAIADGTGYLGYSWFVGYAPADKPKVAFAVLLGNEARWRIKATYVARRLVVEHLALEGDPRAGRMLAAR